MKILTRAEAKAAGKTSYFTGNPCPHGHIAERRTASGSCVQCASGHNRQWRSKNKDRVTECWYRWRKENPEKATAIVKRSVKKHQEKFKEKYKITSRSWRRKNLKKCSEATQRWYLANRDAAKVAARIWRESNPEKARSKYQKWRSANPEAVRAIIHARRARKLAAPGRYTKDDIKDKLAAQYSKCANHRCGCDISIKYSIDHIVALAKGGSNWPDNIQLLCRSCNSKKGTKTMEEWLA